MHLYWYIHRSLIGINLVALHNLYLTLMLLAVSIINMNSWLIYNEFTSSQSKLIKALVLNFAITCFTARGVSMYDSASILGRWESLIQINTKPVYLLHYTGYKLGAPPKVLLSSEILPPPHKLIRWAHKEEQELIKIQDTAVFYYTKNWKTAWTDSDLQGASSVEEIEIQKLFEINMFISKRFWNYL